MKNKKNGFTLVELLATVAILGVLLTISFGVYTKINKNSLNTQLKNKLDYAQIAVNKYSEDYKDEIWEAGCKYIEIKDLINGGYMSSDAKDRVYYENPVDGSDLSSKIYEICYDTSFKTIFMDNYDLYLNSLNLSIGEINPGFKKDNLNYTTLVPYGTKSIVVDATLGKGYMAFLDGFGPREENLNIGDFAETTIPIKIINPDGAVKEYKITVIMDKGVILFDTRSCEENPYTIDDIKQMVSYTGTYGTSWEIFIDGNCSWRAKFYQTGTLTAKKDVTIDGFLVGAGYNGGSEYSGASCAETGPICYWSYYGCTAGNGGRTKTINTNLKKDNSYNIVIGASNGNQTTAFNNSTNSGSSPGTPQYEFGATSGTLYAGNGQGYSYSLCNYTDGACAVGGNNGGNGTGGGGLRGRAGTPNTGGGGGCQRKAGGSGVVVIRNSTIHQIGNFKFSYTGSYAIIDDGNENWRVKLYSSGVLSVLQGTNIDMFMVGGGYNAGGDESGCGAGPDDGSYVCYWGTKWCNAGKGGASRVVEKIDVANGNYEMVIGNSNGGASTGLNYNSSIDGNSAGTPIYEFGAASGTLYAGNGQGYSYSYCNFTDGACAVGGNNGGDGTGGAGLLGKAGIPNTGGGGGCTNKSGGTGIIILRNAQ